MPLVLQTLSDAEHTVSMLIIYKWDVFKVLRRLIEVKRLSSYVYGGKVLIELVRGGCESELAHGVANG